MEVVKQCVNCKHYNPLKGEPQAGWCVFIEQSNVPFWIAKYKTAVEKLGADVSGDEGEECDAFEPGC